MSTKTVFICAGGTGGHLFPAESLAVALKARGLEVELCTDERAEKYGSAFPARETHIVPSATMKGKDPISLAKTLYALGRGFMLSRRLIRERKPVAAVGFGGYPTLPPMYAATTLSVPSIIHDQNAVMGRANRRLAPRVKAIATSFAGVLDGDAALRAKAVFTGNPVRPKVLEAAQMPYDPPQPNGAFRLVVFGGSQGARVMSEIVPPALAKLSDGQRARLTVVQQAREEDRAAVEAAYGRMGVNAVVSPFFVNLPAEMAKAHLVIGRSGASTVAELSVIGRPSILVPLPHALDNDQLANAAALASVFAATLVRQSDFTPEWLAGEMGRILDNPAPLIEAAANAKAQGEPQAAERLADLVMKTAGLA